MATRRDIFTWAGTSLAGALTASLMILGVSKCSGNENKTADEGNSDVQKIELIVPKDSLPKHDVDAHTIIINTGNDVKIDVDNTNSNRDVHNTGNNINSGQINSGNRNNNSGNRTTVISQKPEVVKVPVPVAVHDTVKVPQPVIVRDTVKVPVSDTSSVSEPNKSEKDTIVIKRRVKVKIVQSYTQNSR